jgi:hypothetical protein
MKITTYESKLDCNVECNTYVTISNTVSSVFFANGLYEQARVSMTPDEARRYAEKLIIAANEIDPR